MHIARTLGVALMIGDLAEAGLRLMALCVPGVILGLAIVTPRRFRALTGTKQDR